MQRIYYLIVDDGTNFSTIFPKLYDQRYMRSMNFRIGMEQRLSVANKEALVANLIASTIMRRIQKDARYSPWQNHLFLFERHSRLVKGVKYSSIQCCTSGAGPDTRMHRVIYFQDNIARKA